MVGLCWKTTTRNKGPNVQQSSLYDKVTYTAALENEWAFTSYIPADSEGGGGIH